jgi:hypothetical protein
MRKLVEIGTLLLMTVSIFLPQHAVAQAPEKMSYQAVVRNSSDQLVVNTQVGMKISIQKYVLGIPPSYQNVYIETHTPTTNENGLFSLEIGDGTVVGGVFADIDWSNGEYYIKTETDPTGGTSYSIAGTSQLLSVPYALHAKNAKTYKVGDLAYDGIVFWVDESGQHGLVCTKVDLSTYDRWYAGTSISVPTGSRSGRDNTLLILSLQTPTDDNGGYAAKTCINYYYGVNFMGWYLPSMEELHRMYQQRNIINATALANGGTALGNYDYWSSTQFNGAFAFYENLQSGSSGTDLKSDGKAVRAVRAF